MRAHPAEICCNTVPASPDLPCSFVKYFLLVIAASCGPVTADRPDAAPPMGVTEIAPPGHADDAIAIIEQSFETDTGVELAGVAVHVRWSSTLLACGDTECGGLSYGCGDIWVVDRPGTMGIPMALAHELGHCARGVLTGDSDGGHTDAAWWSDTGYVEHAHQAVRAAGF